MSRLIVKQTVDIYLASFEQMRVVRWRSFSWMPKFRPMWLIRFLKEDNLQHVAGMLVLAELTFHLAEILKDASINSLDHSLVMKKIVLHDAEERIVGDARAKDKKYYVKERSARAKILKWLRGLNRNDLASALSEYPEKKTAADRFVKVLDELQAFAFMLYVDKLSWSNRDIMNPESIKGFKMAEEFPVLEELAYELVGRLQERLSETK